MGTDVSAKYRGAFCEASVKVVKKHVKCKVSLQRSEHCAYQTRVDTRVSVWVVFPVLFNSLNRFSFFLLQITFAKTNTSFTVNDDCVKGSLKVNFLFIVWASMNVIPLDNLLPRFPSCCFDTLVFEHFKVIF